MSLKKVLFFSPFGADQERTVPDVLLAAALKSRGIVVCMVSCDGIYKSCDLHLGIKNSPGAFCSDCSFTGRRLMAGAGLPFLQIKDYLLATDYKFASGWVDDLDPADYPNAMYGDVPIGRWTIASVLRYFNHTGFRLDHPWVRQIHKQMLTNAMLTHGAMVRALSEFQPDAVCLDNAELAVYRTAYETARTQGVRVLTHTEGYRPRSVMFFSDARPEESGPLVHDYAFWKNVPLSFEQASTIGEQLAPSFNPWSHNLRHLLRLPSGSKTLGLFMVSDRQCQASDRVRESLKQLELLDALLAVFQHRSETLLVRVHPETGSGPAHFPEFDLLSELHQRSLEAGSNMRFVMPAEQISDEDLLPYLDWAVIPADNLLLKFAASGLPCLTLADSPFAPAAAATIETVSASAVDAAVNRLLQSTREGEVATQALRNASFLLNTVSLPINFESNGSAADPVDITRLLGRHPWIETVIEHLINDERLIPLPGAPELTRNEKEESNIITAQLAAKHISTRAICDRAAVYAASRIKPDLGAILVSAGTLTEDQLAETAWLRRSRYENINLYGMPLDADADFRQRIDALVPVIMSLREDYILLGSDLATYEEWFISAAMDAMLNDEATALKAVVCGAWIKNQRNRFEKELFTARVPAEHFVDALRVLPAVKQPLTLISFGIFRKIQLVKLLEALRMLESSEQAAQAAFAFLGREDVLRFDRAGLAVTYKPEVVVIRKHQGF